MQVRDSGYKVDQSALVFKNGSRIQFYGDKNLINYLSRLPYGPIFNKVINF